MSEYKALGPDDLEPLLDAAKAFFDESDQYIDIPMDVGRSRAVLSALLDNEKAVVFAAVHGDLVIGLAIAEIVPGLWADRDFVQEHAIYVRPSYRKGRIGHDLIKLLVGWADANGAGIHVTVSSGVDDDRAAKLMERHGLQRRGWLMGKEAA